MKVPRKRASESTPAAVQAQQPAGGGMSGVPSLPLPMLPGVQMPVVGLGMCCRPAARGPLATQSIVDFLSVGGRHVDTAMIYDNHQDIAKGLQQSSVPRSEVFLVSKIPGESFGFDAAWAAVKNVLQELEVDYIDLLLLHWAGSPGVRQPGDPTCVGETEKGVADWKMCRLGSWAALEQAHRMGLVRAIGVSNFGTKHLSELMEAGSVMPAVNQIEHHPWFPNSEIVDFCHRHGIVVTAYGSMGGSTMSGQVVNQDALRQIGEAYGKTPGQVLLRWAIQNNVTVIPGTASVQHMRENLQIFDFVLKPEELGFLNSAAEMQEMHLFGHKPELIV